VGGSFLTDKERAIENILNFLNNPNDKRLLLKGYDDDVKLRVTLGCLNKEFTKGIIRTNYMADIAYNVNRAFQKKMLPEPIKSTINYRLGSMIVNISSYSRHTKFNPRGNQETFTLFFPVQSVFDNPNRYENFLQELDETNSRKIILLTTNEHSISNWDIENHVDQIYFYDVENDNPELMTNMRNNGAFKKSK